MTANGRLTFLDKSWWPEAQKLKEGESFTLDLNGDGRPDTLITRRDGHIIQAIDDSGKAADIWNRTSTAYLVSYRGTGVVDRMVVYNDFDGDGKSDGMEMRHYQDGYLRYIWFADNYDNDGVPVFALKNWHYAGGNALGNRFRGNMQIYLNKYDPKSGRLAPLSECPFAFWDDDRDGHADVALRVSAAPLSSLKGDDPDYANNYKYMWAPETVPLEEIGNLNVRFSLNIDPVPRRDPLNRPHFNFGFTMVGAVPYATYPNILRFNPKRRPPQTAVTIAWEEGQAAALNYPAQETGFTWDEAREVWRWEGQFWIFERVFLPNTGGPTHRWNMRREYSPKPSSHRRLYYSEADRRYHLWGATEGWMEAGHLVNQQKDLEFRWFDKDGDGYLDTVQVFEGDNPLPSRESRFAPRAREAALDRDALREEYNRKVLPEAIEDNRRMIAVLKKFASSPAAEAYEAEAERSETAERKRYCLDIARELLFLRARAALLARAQDGPYPAGSLDKAKFRSMEPGSREKGYSLGDSVRFWDAIKQAEAFFDLYAAGDYLAAAAALASIDAARK